MALSSRRNFFVRLKLTEGGYKNRLLLVALLFTAIKIITIFYSQMPLWADEAQYWVWSKKLDFGYYSKPPLIAWVIHAATTIINDSEFAIRLPATLAHLVTCYFVYKLGRLLFSKKCGYFSALIYLFLPAVTFSSHFISTDALLIMFWAIAAYFCVLALKYNKFAYWLLMGVSVGLGMLSKYTIILFYPSLFAYLLFAKEHRNLAIFRNFIFSGIIAVAVFSPNILWNLNNGLVSAHHTQDNVLTGGVALYPLETLEFLIAQIVIIGPIFAAIYLYFLWKRLPKIFSIRFEHKILMFLSLPLAGAGFFISLISTAQAHWIAPFYVFASIQLANFCLKKFTLRTLKISLLTNVIISLAFIFVTLVVNGNERLKNSKYMERLFGVVTVAAPAKEFLKQHPNAVVLTDERKTAALLLYYTRDENGNPSKVFKWNKKGHAQDYFDMNYDFANQIGHDALLISRYGIEDKSENFIYNSEININGLSKKFKAYYLQGFGGYNKTFKVIDE